MELNVKNTFFLLVVVALLAVLTNGTAIISSELDAIKQCPPSFGDADAVANTLTGTWFLYAQSSSIANLPLNCIRYTFSDPGPNNELSLTINGRKPSRFGFGLPVTRSGQLFPVTGFNTYRMSVFGSTLFPRDFTLVDFDDAGGNWIVARSCITFGKIHAQQYYVFTRSQTPPPADINSAIVIIGLLNEAMIATPRLIIVDQSRCP